MFSPLEEANFSPPPIQYMWISVHNEHNRKALGNTHSEETQKTH